MNLKFLFLLSFSLLFAACEKKEVQKKIEPGNIIVVCDDYNIDNWHQYLDSFNKYQIKLTLYISNYHQFAPQDIGTLRVFQSRFDEIGFHTLNHLTYDKGNTDTAYINEYLKNEIDLGLSKMNMDGYYPKSFAFPGDVHNQQIFDSLKTRFRNVRQGSFGYFEYWKKHKEYSVQKEQRDQFYTYSIDNAALFELNETVEMIKSDLKKGKTISFCIHSLSENTASFTTSPAKFFALIRALEEVHPSYLTVTEYFQ